jgi:hypothetical protein
MTRLPDPTVLSHDSALLLPVNIASTRCGVSRPAFLLRERAIIQIFQKHTQLVASAFGAANLQNSEDVANPLPEANLIKEVHHSADSEEQLRGKETGNRLEPQNASDDR